MALSFAPKNIKEVSDARAPKGLSLGYLGFTLDTGVFRGNSYLNDDFHGLEPFC